ncbi:MAG: DnaD domain protein [Candidatus Paraimprobicoccus trichonymphae]|uniref:DnaD domain protein n=1 Tax=Candidatus Paraimprobicoccus trichonymphae TaxID=3033793 RepID=A0AA48KZY2_9FIRM|nr:MAG: DnaD domain protein [Candidatus Paraimprobicoccus trichonymphae]
MRYKLNPDLLGTSFIIPDFVMDKYINILDFFQLKVLLFILRNPSRNFYIENISNFLDLECKVIKDSLNFLLKHEIIVGSDLEFESDICLLIKESEVAFGRLLSGNDLDILIDLYKSKNLPIELIVFLINYCKSINRATIPYIKAVGISWSKKDINTVAKAQSHLVANKKSIKVLVGKPSYNLEEYELYNKKYLENNYGGKK